MSLDLNSIKLSINVFVSISRIYLFESSRSFKISSFLESWYISFRPKALPISCLDLFACFFSQSKDIQIDFIASGNFLGPNKTKQEINKTFGLNEVYQDSRNEEILKDLKDSNK